MPRYYYDLQTDRDEIGVVLPDATASRAYAMRYAGELIRDLEVGARGQEYWRMDVRGEERALFSLVVEVMPVAADAQAEDPWAEDRGRRLAG